MTTPLRGTQSLVGVMAFVFRHPSLTALELLWRWLAAAPLLYLAWRALDPALAALPLDTLALGNLTFFEPVRSLATLAGQARLFGPTLGHTARWWIPLALLTWTAAATLGRTAILRRADTLWTSQQIGLGPGPSQLHPTPSLQPRLLPMAVFTLLRVLAFLLLLALWAEGLLTAVRSTMTNRLNTGGDPNLVLFTAEAVALTLIAFLLWSTSVWVLDLAPLQAGTPLRTPPPQRAQLRSKLMETNLIMGIVRIILLVLAMTFSASPLPFQSRETEAYIEVWWAGVALFYVLSSDFFHVVRRVTYLRLLQSIAGQTIIQTNAAAPPAS